MARVVELKDLSKHLPDIVFNEKLKNLTAEQIESVALLMETSYQKGKEDSLKTVEVVDQTKIEKAVKEEIDKMYNNLRNHTLNYKKGGI